MLRNDLCEITRHPFDLETIIFRCLNEKRNCTELNKSSFRTSWIPYPGEFYEIMDEIFAKNHVSLETLMELHKNKLINVEEKSLITSANFRVIEKNMQDKGASLEPHIGKYWYSKLVLN